MRMMAIVLMRTLSPDRPPAETRLVPRCGRRCLRAAPRGDVRCGREETDAPVAGVQRLRSSTLDPTGAALRPSPGQPAAWGLPVDFVRSDSASVAVEGALC